ncbi:aspartyl protease family protein 2 isoform X2 [Manihot esculenta]|nr:aspartyl protease family protein 2 isoform X2 [Manihot esculenta]
MLSKFSLLLVLLLLFSGAFEAIEGVHEHKKNLNSNISTVAGIELPEHMTFNAVSSSPMKTDCKLSRSRKDQPTQSIAAQEEEDDNDDDDDDLDVYVHGDEGKDSKTVKLELKRRHRSMNQESKAEESFIASTTRDLTRIQTLHKRITEKKNQNAISRLTKGMKEQRELLKQPVVAPAASPESYSTGISGQLMATLESGVSLGSGEYFMDVFIGTPPKHFPLILDTGSDLNWIQCVPCHDCFEQNGPYYDPKESTSFKNISCKDPRCHLVSSPDPPQPCKAVNQTCPYFYWYGDSSNTTGDFAVETFTVNLTSAAGNSAFKRVENVMFGCGHWNRGLFHGAAGLLGLGRGPLSFASQLQSLYGHSFSYCLVDRNSDSNVSSKLIFGEDKDLLSHPELNFTSLVAGKENPVDTFYYVQIKSIMVGGEVLNIPEKTWNVSSDGAGGTIVDSGTTLSYFAEPAYQIIKDAFVKKVKGYPVLKDFPILDPCYNVSGVEKMELPEFGILFADGAMWNFPVENYFIRFEPEEVVCLAILGTPQSALSIIGNYQQQNFHILYDTNKSRLGFAPMNCADV